MEPTDFTRGCHDQYQAVAWRWVAKWLQSVKGRQTAHNAGYGWAGISLLSIAVLNSW